MLNTFFFCPLPFYSDEFQPVLPSSVRQSQHISSYAHQSLHGFIGLRKKPHLARRTDFREYARQCERRQWRDRSWKWKRVHVRRGTLVKTVAPFLKRSACSCPYQGRCEMLWVRYYEELGYQHLVSTILASPLSSDTTMVPSLWLLFFDKPYDWNWFLSSNNIVYSDMEMETRLQKNPSLGGIISGWHKLDIFLRGLKAPWMSHLLWSLLDR